MGAVDRLLADLRVIFAARLISLVVYGRHAAGTASPDLPIHTLALVHDIGFADLEACARQARRWQADGLAVPLMIGRREFARSLDVFPLEFGAIISNHRVVFGDDPFQSLAVKDQDVRRACEIDVKGHLLHLRESYVESHGEMSAVARAGRGVGRGAADAGRQRRAPRWPVAGIARRARLAPDDGPWARARPHAGHRPGAERHAACPGRRGAHLSGLPGGRRSPRVVRGRVEMTSRAFALVVALLLCALPADAQAPPALTGAVNDFAGVIDAANREAIARLSDRLQQTTGDVLVVATVKTFKPEADIRSYAVKMFQNGGRGIGIKGKDNGLLVLLAVDDRQVWIEVGYGLEPYITDGFSGETSRQTMVPYFKQGDYGGGLLAGSQRLAARVAEGQGKALGDDVAPRPARERERDTGFPIPWPIVIFLLFIIVSRMAARAAAAPHVGQQLERLVERRGAVWRRVRWRLWRRVVGRIRRRVWWVWRRPQRWRRRRRIVVILAGARTRSARVASRMWRT